jgi:N-acetylglutamate synthase-like GNAT family acetyltransferase
MGAMTTSPARIRTLEPGDEAALEAFLRPRADASMFLRANVRAVGFVDDGRPLGGRYVAAWRDDRIVGVVGHAWMGNLMLQAPEALTELVAAAVAASGRPVAGLVGPWTQVLAARAALGFEDRPAELVSKDILFSLDLGRLVVPEPLARGEWTLRAARGDDLELLARWRAAYAVEILGATASPELAARSREEMRESIERQRAFVLEDAAGEPLGCSAFNATLPEMVQVGGVYTPPAFRSRGVARAAVAGSLLAARSAGVERAILFTGEDNHAQRPYRAIGFEAVGDYGLVLFAAAGEAGEAERRDGA